MLPTNKKRKNMKTMKQKDKALSSVVASIILIAVTVTASILTAGWLGTTAVHYTEIDTIAVKNVQFIGTAGEPTNTIILSLKNTGTRTINIEIIKINENRFIFNTPSDENTYAPAETKDLTVDNVGWQTGAEYNIEVYGNAMIVGAYRANSLNV